MKDKDYPIGQKKCANCGEIMDIYSNAQKYCPVEDNPECEYDRYSKKLWEKGKHPLQQEHPEFKPLKE